VSISAIKQALEALETDPCKENAINNAQFFIKQAIAEAEDAVAAEREACAKVCETLAKNKKEYTEAFRNGADWCAEYIRARGET
jgi:DNA-binding transcriptional MerR regulator